LWLRFASGVEHIYFSLYDFLHGGDNFWHKFYYGKLGFVLGQDPF